MTLKVFKDPDEGQKWKKEKIIIKKCKKKSPAKRYKKEKLHYMKAQINARSLRLRIFSTPLSCEERKTGRERWQGDEKDPPGTVGKEAYHEEACL